MMATPGGTQSHGCDSSVLMFRATLSILPQLDVGGWMPTPRNESPASSKMALAIPNVA